jgi:hypothetical protein
MRSACAVSPVFRACLIAVPKVGAEPISHVAELIEAASCEVQSARARPEGRGKCCPIHTVASVDTFSRNTIAAHARSTSFARR